MRDCSLWATSKNRHRRKRKKLHISSIDRHFNLTFSWICVCYKPLGRGLQLCSCRNHSGHSCQCCKHSCLYLAFKQLKNSYYNPWALLGKALNVLHKLFMIRLEGFSLGAMNWEKVRSRQNKMSLGYLLSVMEWIS